MFYGKTDIPTRGLILFSKTILKNCFSEKFKMKITYGPKLHFFKERFTERQIFSLELLFCSTKQLKKADLSKIEILAFIITLE